MISLGFKIGILKCCLEILLTLHTVLHLKSDYKIGQMTNMKKFKKHILEVKFGSGLDLKIKMVIKL